MNGEKECDQYQLRKTTKLQKELQIRINTFQKKWEQVETTTVSNSEEEDKYLSEFHKLQSIIDTAKNTKIDLEYRRKICGRNWRRRKNKKRKDEKNVNVAFREREMEE